MVDNQVGNPLERLTVRLDVLVDLNKNLGHMSNNSLQPPENYQDDDGVERDILNFANIQDFTKKR